MKRPVLKVKWLFPKKECYIARIYEAIWCFSLPFYNNGKYVFSLKSSCVLHTHIFRCSYASRAGWHPRILELSENYIIWFSRVRDLNKSNSLVDLHDNFLYHSENKTTITPWTYICIVLYCIYTFIIRTLLELSTRKIKCLKSTFNNSVNFFSN
jgi:hypothetical protein